MSNLLALTAVLAVSFGHSPSPSPRVHERKTDSRPVLLKVNMEGGHGASSGRYDATREYAFELAVVLWQLGGSQ